MTLDERSKRRGRRKALIYPYASGPHSYVDPSGHEATFHGDTPEVFRDLYLAVSQSTLATFKEIWEVAHMIAYGPECRNPDGSWTLNKKLKQSFAQSKNDAVSLDRPNLPLSDLIDIWERSCAHLRLLAEHYPAERDAILKKVEESERRLAELTAKYRAKVEEKMFTEIPEREWCHD
jgi:hypothetical protein